MMIEDYDRVVIVNVEIMHAQSIGDKHKQTSKCEDVNDKMDSKNLSVKCVIIKLGRNLI